MNQGARVCGPGVRRGGVMPPNRERFIAIKLVIDKITDYTDLIIADAIHDYCNVGEKPLSEETLRHYCRVIASGLSEALIDTAELEDTIFTSARKRLTDMGWSPGQTIEHFESKFVSAALTLFEVSGCHRRDKTEYAADTCRVNSDDAICKMYKDVSGKKKFVTAATAVDSGFTENHVDYGFCDGGTDYVFINYEISISLRTDAAELQFLRIVAGVSDSGKAIINMRNNAMNRDENYSRDRLVRGKVLEVLKDNLTNGRKFKTVYNSLTGRFCADLGQVLYVAALRSISYVLNGNGRRPPPGVSSVVLPAGMTKQTHQFLSFNWPKFVTNDRLLALASIVLARHSVITRYENRTCVELKPNIEALGQTVPLSLTITYAETEPPTISQRGAAIVAGRQ